MKILRNLLIETKSAIKHMILRFVTKIQEKLLITYHIVIDFRTREEKPTRYRLELLAELRNETELGNLTTQLHGQLSTKFTGYNTYTKEIKTQYERQTIINSFNNKLKNHISMKFIFRQWVNTFEMGEKTIRVNDETIEKNGVKDYRVNILKTGKIPFSAMQDMFCVELDTTNFK